MAAPSKLCRSEKNIKYVLPGQMKYAKHDEYSSCRPEQDVDQDKVE